VDQVVELAIGRSDMLDGRIERGPIGDVELNHLDIVEIMPARHRVFHLFHCRLAIFDRSRAQQDGRVGQLLGEVFDRLVSDSFVGADDEDDSR
jgi:hypothetical protein